MRAVRWLGWLIVLGWALGLAAVWAQPGQSRLLAQQGGAAWSALGSAWMLLAAFLVFSMNAGFALLEAGFCRTKNAVHALGKNFVVVAVAALAFWMVGFALMFGRGNELIGAAGFLFGERSAAFRGLYPCDTPLFIRFLFQLAYCGIATTIISGAVASACRRSCASAFTGGTSASTRTSVSTRASAAAGPTTSTASRRIGSMDCTCG